MVKRRKIVPCKMNGDCGLSPLHPQKHHPNSEINTTYSDVENCIRTKEGMELFRVVLWKCIFFKIKIIVITSCHMQASNSTSFPKLLIYAN